MSTRFASTRSSLYVLLFNLPQSRKRFHEPCKYGFFFVLLPLRVSRHPLTILTDVQQESIILASVLFEVGAEVEHGFGQQSLGTEQRRDEESTNASVSIQKWMHGLKMIVNEGHAHERRVGCVGMEILLSGLGSVLATPDSSLSL